MAPRIRIPIAREFCHVMARGNRREWNFADAEDRPLFCTVDVAPVVTSKVRNAITAYI